MTKSSTEELNFALAIEEAEQLRHSIVRVLRECGWLVHGMSQTAQAFNILAHIPYSLIVLNSEPAGICAADVVRFIQDSQQWQTIRLVIITDPDTINLDSEAGQLGAFLARRSKWEEDLVGFLSAHAEEPKTGKLTATPSLTRAGLKYQERPILIAGPPSSPTCRQPGLALGFETA